MNKSVCRMLLSMAALTAPVLLYAAEKDEAGDASIALVHKAAVYIKVHGRDQALAEFGKPAGAFAHPDFFVYDVNAKRLLHGNNPKMIGKNLEDLKDSEGQPIIQRFKDVTANQGQGWVEYRWPNPATGRIGTKASYVEHVGDLLLGSGIFKN